MQILGSIVATVFALVVGVMLGLPVVETMGKGEGMNIAALTNAGPVAGIMAYVLLVPILLPLCRTFLTKMLGVLISVAISMATILLVTAIQNEAYGQAVLLLCLYGLVGMGVFYAFQYWHRHQRQRTMQLTHDISHLMGKIADDLQERYKASPQEMAEPSAPFHHAKLVERLVFGVLTQASLENTPRGFANVLVHGIHDVADSLQANTRQDPEGHAPRIANIYLSRVQGYLKGQGLNIVISDSASPFAGSGQLASFT